MMEILAEEFTAAGHQVKVATQVATKVERDRDYEIVRLPILKSCVADCAHFCGRQSSGHLRLTGPFQHPIGVQEDCGSVQPQYLLQRSGTVAYSGTVGRHS